MKTRDRNRMKAGSRKPTRVVAPIPYDVAVVGLGMVGVHQITREVEETIRRCQRLFITDMAVGVVDYLKTLCPDIVDLTSLRDLGTHRIEIYRRMASAVVAGAMEKPPVCFATYGHPNLYCYPTTLIQRATQILDLKTVVLPGVSSIDTLLSELAIDPGFDGLQLYEATDLLIRRRAIQPDVACVIVQAPIVLEARNLPGERSIKDLRLLQNYLLKFYPGTHTVALVTIKTHPLLESIRQNFPLERLAETLMKSSNMATLYLPPLQHREVADPALAQRMQFGESEARASTARRPGRPPIGPQAG